MKTFFLIANEIFVVEKILVNRIKIQFKVIELNNAASTTDSTPWSFDNLYIPFLK